MREVEASGSTAGVDPKLGQRTRKHGRRIEVGKGRRRGRIGQIVRRHINGLHGRDRTLLRRRNPLLQLAHFGGKIRLVSDGGRHTPKQRRNLGTRLREAEYVVDEQQRVRTLFVAEVLGDSEAGQRHPQTRSRRLGHLAVNQRGFALREVLQIDNARLLELMPEIVALTGPLSDAGGTRRNHRAAARRC